MELTLTSQDPSILLDWSDSCHGSRQTGHRDCGNIRHFTLSLECKTSPADRDFMGKPVINEVH